MNFEHSDLCNELQGACRCIVKWAEEHTMHKCECGGSWSYDPITKRFVVHSWPGGIEEERF